MPDALSLEEVRHVATLARLRLTDEELEAYRSQLSSVLEHIATLDAVDTEGVEPMAHPLDATNRLADDTVGEPMPIAALLANAPGHLDRYLTVPKVLGDEAEAGG